MTMKPWVEIEQLQKRIDKFQLGPIDLKIEPGTVTALVGNNGSGKSTLLKLMMNLVKPDLGSIKLFNQFVYGKDESWKVNVAYQPQTPIGYNGFTGESLKRLVARFYPNWDEQLFTKMVQLLQIPLTKQFDRLSQGAQQKLILALTIPRNAKLLILDEPTSFIDIPSKKILTDLLVDWLDAEERSVIIASHQAEDIKKLSDYLYVLRNGKNIGHFERECLTDQYRRYWLNEPLPTTKIPGEAVREEHGFISDQPKLTEQFLNEEGIRWSKQTAIDLDEIITLLLTAKSKKG